MSHPGFRKSIRVNGVRLEAQPVGLETLLDFLHGHLDEPAPLEACGEGDCGSCAVLLNNKVALSCLMPAVQAQGGEVETAQHLLQGHDPVSALFREFAATFACGSCLGGFLVATRAYLKSHPGGFDAAEFRNAVSGQLCPCGESDFITRSIEQIFHAEAPASESEGGA